MDGLYNVTDSLLARAIPVRPHPDAPPTPPTAPITKPGDKTPDEPVRLVPGDKKPDGDNTPVGKPVSDKDPDFPLLCMRGNGECRRSRHDDDYYRREYETRGSAVLGKHTRRERSDFPDYGPRLESRYAHKDHYYQDSVEDSFDSLPSLGKYGFEPSDFEAQSVYSKKHRQDRDGNLLYNDKGEARYTRDSDPILEFSHSRKRHEDVDREVFVAHHRYKNRDRNVYDLDYDGNPRNVDEWGDPIPRSTWKDDSVPAFQMMHEKSKVSALLLETHPIMANLTRPLAEIKVLP